MTRAPAEMESLNSFTLRALNDFWSISSNLEAIPFWFKLASWKKYEGGFGISLRIALVNSYSLSIFKA